MADLITATALPFGIKRSGKVRDVYEVGDALVLVTTDRLSAFDRQLAVIPSKGAVLNLVSAFWMNATRDICPNALLATPHPNVSVMRRCAPFRVEVVVRAYLTGTTSTSIWSHYSKGAREYCGHALPDGAPTAAAAAAAGVPLVRRRC
jgi:phosphoribosylaminoimidazole-succinocarboxamide synthase